MKILFVNACVRSNSRSKLLADKILSELNGELLEIDLQKEGLLPLDGESLSLRDALCESKAWDDPSFSYARDFASADHIVIAAPYWDLGFPALLKIYLERVTVAGITFSYRDGVPIGLCRAKKLTFVTTSGGAFQPDFSFDYLRALAESLYGIRECECYYAEGMDLDGITQEKFWDEAKIMHIPANIGGIL